LAAFAPVASAQVSDGADFFGDRAERQAAQMIRDIEQRHGASVVVETYDGIPSSVRQQLGGLSASEFYSTWLKERGKATRADVVILVVRGDTSRVEVGASEATRQSGVVTVEDTDSVRDTLLSGFRSKDFDGGLLTALEQLEQRFAAAPAAGRNAARLPPVAAPRDTAPPARAPAGDYPADRPPAEGRRETQESGGGMGMFKWLLLLGGGALVLYMIWTRMRAKRSADPVPQPQRSYPATTPSRGGGLGGLGGILGGVLGGMGRGRAQQSGEWANDPDRTAAGGPATRLPPTAGATTTDYRAAETRTTSGGYFDSGDGARDNVNNLGGATNPDRPAGQSARRDPADRTTSGGNF
jgi:uncharacterized membrane protein YgcG